jgi:hypothetical protein
MAPRHQAQTGDRVRETHRTNVFGRPCDTNICEGLAAPRDRSQRRITTNMSMRRDSPHAIVGVASATARRSLKSLAFRALASLAHRL